MSIEPTAEIAVRSGGAATNGGAYVPSGGIDYTLQNVPQLTVTDAVGTGTTTITSATGGFTADMAGNYIFVAGNRFRITNVPDANTITVHQTTGTFSAQTLHVGGAVTINDIIEIAGTRVYIDDDGVHTLTAHRINPAGTYPSSQIQYIGITGADKTSTPHGSNRPQIVRAGKNFDIGDYNWLSHLRIACTDTGAFRAVGSATRFIDIHADHTGTSASKSALDIQGSDILLLDSRFSKAGAGYCVNLGGLGADYGHIVGCLLDGGGYGVVQGSGRIYLSIISSIFANHSIAGYWKGERYGTVDSCTFHGCGIGIQHQDVFSFAVINSIFSSCGTALAGLSVDYGANIHTTNNNFWNNTTDFTNWSSASGSLAFDPQFSDAANLDFTVRNQNLLQAGFPQFFGTSPQQSYPDIGAVQAQPPAAVGGTTGHISFG